MILRKSNSIVFIGMCFFVLSGCSQINTSTEDAVKSTKPSTVKPNGWYQRKAIISRDQTWKLTSKISLRFSDENWIFGLKWAQQNNANFILDVSNPLTGALVAKLRRSGRGVTLLANNGKSYSDTDEERLLQRQTNLKLPVKGLQYWVRGISSPQYKIDKLILDPLGRPQVIHQAGWRIKYSNYISNKFNAMPKRIVLTRVDSDLYLKIIAKQWRGI